MKSHSLLHYSILQKKRKRAHLRLLAQWRTKGHSFGLHWVNRAFMHMHKAKGHNLKWRESYTWYLFISWHKCLVVLKGVDDICLAFDTMLLFKAIYVVTIIHSIIILAV